MDLSRGLWCTQLISGILEEFLQSRTSSTGYNHWFCSITDTENKDKRIEAGMSRPMLYTRRRFACMQPLYRAIMTHANAIGPVTIYSTMGTNRRPIFFGILIKFLFAVVFLYTRYVLLTIPECYSTDWPLCLYTNLQISLIVALYSFSFSCIRNPVKLSVRSFHLTQHELRASCRCCRYIPSNL